MEFVIYFFILFLSILGLCDIVHFISIAILDNRKRKNKIAICLLKDEKADFDLRFMAEQYDWMGRKYADRVLAVSFLPQGSTLDTCKAIAERYDIEIVSTQKLTEIIGEYNGT